MDQGIMQIMPLVLIGVVFYFLLIRPQQKRAKDHKAMIAAVSRGDNVVTSGGIMGKVTKVRDDNVVQVEIAPEVKINVVKSTLTDVKGKVDPAAAAPSGDQSTGAGGGGLLSKLFKK
ncbi:MAG: preprotein translocase subunit YajC [Sneathiella sp.]|uniref:preprotein translocase subunit YajC n=1 Tax=Sneathiella sp. TaxID=1964365 RepID=UPI003002B246